MSYKFIFLLPLLLLFACTDDDDSTPPIRCAVAGANQQGDQIQVPNDAGFVSITNVENNLCPCDVQCVFAGTIDVTMRLGEEETTIRWTPGPDLGLARDSLGPWRLSVDTVYNENLCPMEIRPEDICLGISFR